MATDKQKVHKRHHHFDEHKTAFIHAHLATAQHISAQWGVPASVLLAQAALESGWGMHVKGNAYFGIKGRAAGGNTITFATHEFTDPRKKIEIRAAFRAYKDFSEAAEDYAKLLASNGHYVTCFAYKNDGLSFAECIGHSHYATDPTYGEKLLSIIRHDHLNQYDK